jgi:flagellin-specific chaperone FliS
MVIELNRAEEPQDAPLYERQAADASALVGRVLAEIAAAREAADEGNVRGRAQRIASAMATLNALQWSAQADGSALGDQLAALYRYAAERLLAAHFDNGENAFSECTALLVPIFDALKAAAPPYAPPPGYAFKSHNGASA